MAYRIRHGPIFLRDVEDFGRYCADYCLEFADEQFERLTFAIETLIAEAPLTWAYFVHSGEPYRAYLFRVGQRTRFWIVYSIDEEAGAVSLLRLWGAARDPRRFAI